ncbi:hypothetical protein SDC9_64072 [bioreactor metagenome]|uniref:Chromosome partition protein Smc n=1 Tax=bioreactor metagenome TaxID=1076179 RepID=A0A644XNF7_9ZZZZ|nr:hypothetical protein [Propionibacterium sp.]
MTQASFRLVRKGYEPSEVDQRVAQLSASIQQLQSDLARAHDDNAVQAVENTKLRQANSDLAGRIEMLEQAVQEVRDERDNGVPPTFANLGGRIGQMLTLAQEEADELRSTAQAEAEKLTADTKQQAADALAAAQQEAGELRSRAEADAARTIEDAKQQADHLRESADGEATARLEEAEAVYEAQRAQAAAAAADFEQTLAERRAEAMNELNSALEKKTTEVEFATDKLNQARAEAARVTSDAREQAEQIVRDAQNQANTLLTEAKQRAEGIRQNSERELAAATARRDSITAQLSNVRQMLGTLGGPQQAFIDPTNPRTAQDWAAKQEAAEQAAAAKPEEADAAQETVEAAAK